MRVEPEGLGLLEVRGRLVLCVFINPDRVMHKALRCGSGRSSVRAPEVATFCSLLAFFVFPSETAYQVCVLACRQRQGLSYAFLQAGR